MIRHTLHWGFSCLADLTCGYGEHPWRALAAALIVILGFSFLYQANDGIIATHHSFPFDYLVYSMTAFSGIGVANFVTVNPVADLFTGIESLLGIALFALLMFTLGNRMSRL